MSETTGTPAAPAAPAAAPTGQLGTIAPSAPPATSQPAISVSDAARLLGKQRRQGGDAGAEPAAPAAEVRRPSPNEMAAAAKAAATNDNRAATNDNATTKPAPAAASALERALGVEAGEAAPAPAADPNDGTIIEIEGRRLKTAAEIKDFVEAKSYDYTKKMQALAAERQQAQAERQQNQAQQQALATVLPYIQPELARLAQIVQQAPPRPDPSLANTDPGRYVQERAVYEAAMEEQQRLGSLTALQQQAANRAMETQVAAANEELAKEYPWWADPAQRGGVQQEIVDWATTKGGFSRDELRGLASPHHLKTMMKAAMYDKMVSGARSAAPPSRLNAPVRGAPPPPAPSERIQQAEQVFGERPNIRSAAALLAARRGNGQAR
jgi:hypothetical protein